MIRNLIYVVWGLLYIDFVVREIFVIKLLDKIEYYGYKYMIICRYVDKI